SNNSSQSMSGYDWRRYTSRGVSALLRSVKRTHHAECEKPMLVFSGVPATNPRFEEDRLTSAMVSAPPRSSSSSMVEVSDCSCTDLSASIAATSGDPPESAMAELTKTTANSQRIHEIVATSLRLYTIAVLSPEFRLEYATDRAGSNAMRRLLKWTLRLAALVLILAVGFFCWFVLWPAHGIPALEPVDEYVWLDQGWGTGQNSELRRTYYYTPQGTSVPQGVTRGALRYSWFVNLELPFSTERFADPMHLRKLRFVVDPEPSPENPFQLPVGFTKHFDPALREDVLDITCAACHTGEIQHTVNGHTRAIRIDGGQAMHAFTDMSRGNFAPLLLSSLISTSAAPWKFDRFAHQVLGAEYPKGKAELATALRATIRAILAAQQNNPLRGLYPVHEGFGRTDALGRIGNTVFGDHLTSSNYQDGDAPVSFPYLWNIWKFDWVQYNGSVAQPLARNVGEALGVGANTPFFDADGKPLPPEQRFGSTVDIPGLHRIEGVLQMLRPPPWPEQILGAVDREKAARGELLFKERCQECHGPHVAEPARQQTSAPLKRIPGTEWRIEVIPLEHIGTDPTAAQRFIERRYDLSSTGLTPAELAETLRPLL